MKIKCWFDGACNPNPWGPIGYGAYIITPFGEESFYDGVPASKSNSNNVAEYLGLKMILDYINESDFPPNTKFIIWGDSNLVVMQMNGAWRIREGMYRDYALECQDLLTELESMYRIDIDWVSRWKNEMADKLSKEGMAKWIEGVAANLY